MDKKKSRILAAALAVSTMAAFHAAPVMAAPVEGLTVKEDGVISAENEVTLNGVTVNVGKLTASNDITASNNITAIGKLTSYNGSSINAKIDKQSQTKSFIGAGGVRNNVDKWNEELGRYVVAASSDVTTSGIQNTAYDEDGKQAAMTSITKNDITNYVYGDDGDPVSKIRMTKDSITSTVVGNNNLENSLLIGKASVSLKSGNNGFAVDEDGKISITGKNFNVKDNVTATGSFIGKGFTSNNGNIYVKDNKDNIVFSVDTTGNVNANGDITTDGKLTANNGSVITAKNGDNEVKTEITHSGVKDTVTNGTATSTSTISSTSIVDEIKFGDSELAVKSEMSKSGITDTFTTDDGRVHKVTTNGLGTTFSGDFTNDKHNYTTIDGKTAIFGGAAADQTKISGGTITTDTLNVNKIVLGEKIVDKETGGVVGGELEIGANGSITVKEKVGEDLVTRFVANRKAMEAHYGKYDLNMDADNGFKLGYTDSSLTLNNSGFAFSGPVNLGASDKVSFSHNGSSLTLRDLVNKVDIIDKRTQGISYDEQTGNTTIRHEESGNALIVSKDGTTFIDKDGNTTNINGGKITANESVIGNGNAGGGSGSGEAGTGNTITNADGHSGSYENANGDKYEFTANGDGFNSTATDKDGSSVTNKVTGSSSSTIATSGNNTSKVTQTADSVSSMVISGDKISYDSQEAGKNSNLITEGKDKSNSYEQTVDKTTSTITNGKVSSTVSQDKNGQTIVTKDENGKEATTEVTGKDVVINKGTDDEVSLSNVGSRVDNLEQGLSDLNSRVDKLDERIDKVGAMSAAIANLRTMGYDPTAPTEIAVGVGQYRSETGVALGMFHYPNRDFMLSLSVSTSGDEVMGGIGATWKFGCKSPEQIAKNKAARAEKAKLAKAEALKKEARAARVAAQQARHAKLAAQKAAK